jgi:hypothetical protein
VSCALKLPIEQWIKANLSRQVTALGHWVFEAHELLLLAVGMG